MVNFRLLDKVQYSGRVCCFALFYFHVAHYQFLLSNYDRLVIFPVSSREVLQMVTCGLPDDFDIDVSIAVED